MFENQPGGKIITFYSYKGGTGRTMALANIAWILACNQQKVLLIDWDLEAPGLHRFFKPFLIDKTISASEGLIDLMIDYADEAIKPAEPNEAEDWYLPYADISNYTLSVNFKFPGAGKIDLVPAGRQNSTYATKVNSFNWENFYDRLSGGAFLEAVKKNIKAEYDYILIDSRTGVSDTAGISTVQMPDMLAVFFTYNNQSIDGASAVASSVFSTRSKVSDETAQHPIKIFPVPTRVEQAEVAKLAKRQRYAQIAFKPVMGPAVSRTNYWSEVEVPYVPFYTYEEVLAAIIDDPADPKRMLRSFIKLTSYLTDNQIDQFALKISTEAKQLIINDFAETPIADDANDNQSRNPASYLADSRTIIEEEPINPFVGVKAFEETDSDYFFGRSTEIDNITGKVIQNKFLILSGPSGSGKTSILKAGIIPAFKNMTQAQKPRIIFITAGNNIFYTLAAAMLKEVNDQTNQLQFQITPIELADSIEQQDNKYTATLNEFFTSTGLYFLLIIDQLEDVFKLSGEQAISTVAKAITHWRKINPAFSAILSVRSDFLPALINHFPEQERNSIPVINLPVLDTKELWQSIVAPAVKAGVNFEPGLVDRIIQDSERTFLNLTLLQNVLQQLWAKRSGNTITHSAYNAIGQMEEALNNEIKKRLLKISPGDLENAKPIITRLVNLEPRARVFLNVKELTEDEMAVLRPFIDLGLISVSTEKKNNNDTIQLSHDLLLKYWPALNEWLNEDQEFLSWRERLGCTIKDWEKSYENDKLLLKDYALIVAQNWLHNRSRELSAKEQMYISKSLLVKNELDVILNSQVSRKRKVSLISIVAVLLIIASVWGIYYYNSARTLANFNTKLSALEQKVGKEKLDSVCALTKFDNRYGNDYIRQKTDSLLQQCIEGQALYSQTQSAIDNNEIKIDTLAVEIEDAGNVKTQVNLKQIDSFEKQLNQLNMRLSSTDDRFVKIALQKKSDSLNSNISKIIRSDRLLISASRLSDSIQNSVKVQSDIGVVKDNPSLYQQNAWFKKNYFLQFENIKVRLVDLSKSNQTITVEFCDMVGPEFCTSPIISPNPVIQVNNSYTFTHGEFKYVLSLDRIGSAGKNPFTPAAYITFLKYKK